MVFFTRKIHRKLGGNFTFLICTDRDDLDTQIYKTFAGCGWSTMTATLPGGQRRGSGRPAGPAQVVCLPSDPEVQRQDVDPAQGYSQRDDIIVITDEAHRTQYGTLSSEHAKRLPNASYIGFTGTPLFKDDEITRRVFGDYVSTYDFQRAVEDKATVPLYYDARGEKLGVTTHETERADCGEAGGIGDRGHRCGSSGWSKSSSATTTSSRRRQRLDQVARDFVLHYSKAWETGKAMLVCIDKVTCVRMYNLIVEYWEKRIQNLGGRLRLGGWTSRRKCIAAARLNGCGETRTAVVVSEEQGEVDKFRKWDLDITPHRRLIKEGIDLGRRQAHRPGDGV